MKIYQTRLGNLSTSVDVNGVLRRVQFLASDGVNGIFSTADEQLQRAMENSRGYGRRFKLSGTIVKEPRPLASLFHSFSLRIH